MKEFKIDFDFDLDFFTTCDNIDYNFLKNLNTQGYIVKSFEDYYNLLQRISNITDGEYYIYNYGTTITSY